MDCRSGKIKAIKSLKEPSVAEDVKLSLLALSRHYGTV
jgi:hypothetical protein